MAQSAISIKPQNLSLYEPEPYHILIASEKKKPSTPNEWFGQRYPEQFEKHGSPFLELTTALDEFSVQIQPITINIDFFASILGGRSDFKHSVIYYEPEMAWYYQESDGIYRATTAEKLANLYRALLMKCSQDMPANVHKVNLVHEWRQDSICKQVTNRAKSILAAGPEFFSATSSHSRIRGIELHERLARKFVDELLTADSGKVLMLADAYLAFCRLLKERELAPVKRSDFKAMVVPIIKDEYDVALRNDLVVDGKAGVRGWKNVRLNHALPT